SDGTFRSRWGVLGTGSGQFNRTSGVAVSRAGHVYVADRDNHRIQMFRPAVFTRPIATIVHLNATTFVPKDEVVAYGLGQDSDTAEDDIVAYRWTSDARPDQVLGITETLRISAGQLAAGTQRLTLQVQDSQGEWSEPVSETIYVGRPPV